MHKTSQAKLRARCNALAQQDLAQVALAHVKTGERDLPLLLLEIERAARRQKLETFVPGDLVKIADAFARTGFGTLELFDEIDAGLQLRVHHLTHKEVATTAWAFATAKHASPKLMDAIAMGPDQAGWAGNAQTVGFGVKTAWAFAAASHDAGLDFSQHLLDCAQSEMLSLDHVSLAQLHQWMLWQRELGRDGDPSSPELVERCHAAFCSETPRASAFQRLVQSTISGFGIPGVEEEVLTELGYFIDVVVEWRGKRIGVEADGPSHFMRRRSRLREPKASTLLKRRQLTGLGGWCLVSIPYHEWPSKKAHAGQKSIRGEAQSKDLALIKRQREYLGKALSRAVASAS